MLKKVEGEIRSIKSCLWESSLLSFKSTNKHHVAPRMSHLKHLDKIRRNSKNKTVFKTQKLVEINAP